MLARRAPELKILERDLTKLEAIKGPFPRISYDEALKVLEKRGVGDPVGRRFRRASRDRARRGIRKTRFRPSHAGADQGVLLQAVRHGRRPGVTGTGKYALGCDLIAPDGYGEIIGGGQREESVEVLKRRIAEHGLNEKDYSWYLDLRRFGSVPHSGFGLGVERTVAWMTGVEHVRETIPFPRMLNTLRP